MIYTIDPKRTALLVIDVQKEYFKEDGPAFIPAARSVLPNIHALIASARSAGSLIVYVRHVNRADGSDLGRMNDFGNPEDGRSFVEGTPEVELIEELHPQDGEPIVTKRRYSSFLNTELECVLRTRGIDAVIISGFMTSFCCETTARDAHGRDYKVLFVNDANEGPDLMNGDGEKVGHDAVLVSTLTALGNGFADIVSTAEIRSTLQKAV